MQVEMQVKCIHFIAFKLKCTKTVDFHSNMSVFFALMNRGPLLGELISLR